MEREKLEAFGFRLPSSVVERLDAFARDHEREHPGMRLTRSNAIRTLLEQALSAAGYPPEAAPAPRKRAR